MFVLDLVNQVLSLIGERSLASSTGSLGGITRSALTTAIHKVAGETRASFFKQMLTFTATNADFLVPAYVIPDSVQDLQKVQYSEATTNRVLDLREQSLALLPYNYSYSVVGNKLYLSPMFARPITLFATAIVIPELGADGSTLNLPQYLINPIAHVAAAILNSSYLDDANAASLQMNIANELITSVRLHYGETRGKSFSMG